MQKEKSEITKKCFKVKRKNIWYSGSAVLNCHAIRHIESHVSLKQQNKKLNHIPLDSLEWGLLSWMFGSDHEQQCNIQQSSPNWNFSPAHLLLA